MRLKYGEELSYLRLIDSCITQLKAQGHSRTCNESKGEDDLSDMARRRRARARPGGVCTCPIDFTCTHLQFINFHLHTLIIYKLGFNQNHFNIANTDRSV